jgi:hypothetical protein
MMATLTAADLVGSATLVALTIWVLVVPGAVKTPPPVMDPPEQVQVTDLLVVPTTVAVKVCAPSMGIAALVGETVTAIPVTVTLAVAVAVGVAAVVAVTV